MAHRPELRHLVFGRLAAEEKLLGEEFRVYEGATFDDTSNGCYSYVPCRPADADDVRFERPVIELPGFVDQNLRMSAGGKPTEPERLRELWERVTDQVLDRGLALGVYAEMPRFGT